jgi:hypothetical protein
MSSNHENPGKRQTGKNREPAGVKMERGIGIFRDFALLKIT